MKKSIKQIQKSLNNNSNIIQSTHYLITHPGLTSFKNQQIISHNQLLNFLQNNPLNSISFLPHIN